MDCYKTLNIGVIWGSHELITFWQNSVCKIKDGRHFSNYWVRWFEKSEEEINWFSPDLKYRCNMIISWCVNTLRKFGLQNSRWPSYKDFSLITDLWNYFSEDITHRYLKLEIWWESTNSVHLTCWILFTPIRLIRLIAEWEMFVSTLSQEPTDGLLPNFKCRCYMRFSWTD